MWKKEYLQEEKTYSPMKANKTYYRKRKSYKSEAPRTEIYKPRD
jgi:hypothetical protein